LPDTPWDPPEESALLDKWGAKWYRELPKLTGISWQTQHYHRGFVCHICATSVRALLNAAPTVFARAPVTWVTLVKLAATTAKQLAPSPVLARIRRFSNFPQDWDPDALVPFADTTHLGNLREVHLAFAGLSAESLRSFLLNRSLTRLARVTLLNFYTAGTAVVSHLVNGAFAPVLEEVHLQKCCIGADGAPLLGELVQLPNIKKLVLPSNLIDSDVLIALAGVRVRKKIEVGLPDNRIGDRGARALLTGPFLRAPGVRLNLWGNRISARVRDELRAKFGDRVSF
jgi:hypothetical protein